MREQVHRRLVELLVLIPLGATISTSSQADGPRMWGDIAGGRLDLQASIAVPVMTFRYGEGPDELPLGYGDDPDETVVRAFQVEENQSVWILTAGGSVCDTLRHFVATSGEARRDRVLPLPGCFSGFIIGSQGIFLSGHTGRAEAQFSLLTTDGVLRPISLVKRWGREGRRGSNVGRMREVAGACYACLSGDCVRIGSQSVPDTLDGDDFLGGLPTRQSEPIWQSERFIMRGTTPVLDLGENDRRYLWDVFEGGFVLGRSSVYADGTPARLVEIFSEDGERVRSLVIPTPGGQYGIGEGGSFHFTKEHVYYLNLDRHGALLLRY